MIARLRAGPSERAFWFGVAATVVTAFAARVRPTPYNNYVRFADAIVHRHLWIVRPGPAIDAVFFRGHYYIVNDPIPGLLLIPAVARFGLATNQTMLAVFLGGIAAAFAWLLAERLGIKPYPRAILTLFFFAGTDLWWCAALGDVWFLAQVSAVAFVTLALAELATDTPRGWVVALALALAIGSRFTLVMSLPVVAYLVGRGNLGDRPVAAGASGRLFAFGSVFAVFFGIWLAYNRARWGVFWDAGHTIFYHQDTLGKTTGSPFALANLPNQIYSFFLAPPIVTNTYPYVIPSPRGTALTWTSPALAFAFVARGSRPLLLAMWAAATLVAIPSFLYYVNGFSQYGMRHALDFEPFLFVLMLVAARRTFPMWVTAAAVYSILATAYGLWFWQTFTHHQTL